VTTVTRVGFADASRLDQRQHERIMIGLDAKDGAA
jgi:hypothetical protein